MKKFLFKIFLCVLPILFLVLLAAYIDFFKIFGYQDYYTNQITGINRGVVTTTCFNEFREKEKFNSFIFGSSRSQAFKCERWVNHLGPTARAFHFDAAGESLWGITKKIEYIDELGDTIRNALLVIDRSTLRNIEPKKNHLLIAMPCVSKDSKFEYYFTFLKASLNLKFLWAYMDYSIFKTRRDYMGHLIKKGKYDNRFNPSNGDMWYGYDKEIEMDSVAYYNKLNEKEVFHKRPVSKITACPITYEEKELLKTISEIFEKHKTKYQIIVSPVYDQIPMEEAQLKLLASYFGKKNIHNYSGVNRFTSPIENYYESSHYKTYIANDILDLVYQ